MLGSTFVIYIGTGPQITNRSSGPEAEVLGLGSLLHQCELANSEYLHISGVNGRHL